MPFQDLRTFLQTVDAYGELKTLRGVALHLEMGAIAEVSHRHDGPALLFEAIPGFPESYRVAANVCSSPRRALLALGMDPNLPEATAAEKFREIWEGFKPVPPRVVNTGPILDNIQTGDDVDLLQFPVPLWHERDAGPYIGTGDAVIHRDPDTGAVNVGTYRVQLHDRRTTGLFTNNGTGGWDIMRKYWAQGKPAPVAISFGPEPLLFASASTANGSPQGSFEYEFTGYLAGEPIPVIEGQVTGLPISANSEIAIEGLVAPPSEVARNEGPFGEWTGYYESSQTPEPVVQVKALYYRNDPIIFGAPPLLHQRSYFFGLNLRSTGMLSRFAQLELPVRRIAPIGPYNCTVISVEQQHADDVPRIMEVLAQGAGFSRLTILVDDDVDPADPWDVLWAVGTRFDPDQARTLPFDNRNMLEPLRRMADLDRSNRAPLADRRMIINGCRPFERLADFPPVNRFSEEWGQKVWDKWAMASWLK
ncbi:MAG TPA: UbiD family decarboxylase [Chloroflexota bacterium]